MAKPANTERFGNLAHDLRGFLAFEDENPAGLLEEITAALDSTQRQSGQLATARKALGSIRGDEYTVGYCGAIMCAPLRDFGIECQHDKAANAIAAIDAAAPEESEEEE